MSRASVEIVCDAGPLIHLDEFGCLHLLDDFNTVFVPEQVWQEVSHHRPGALSNPNVTLQKVKVNVSPPSNVSVTHALNGARLR